LVLVSVILQKNTTANWKNFGHWKYRDNI